MSTSSEPNSEQRGQDWLSYRIGQIETSIMEEHAASLEQSRSLQINLEAGRFGVAADSAKRMAWRLHKIIELTREHKGLIWVQKNRNFYP